MSWSVRSGQAWLHRLGVTHSLIGLDLTIGESLGLSSDEISAMVRL